MTIAHDPDANLDYTFDWTAWLTTSPGDAIATATVTADDPDAATLSAPEEADGKVTFWLSEATKSVTVTCHIVTAQGRKDDRSIWFQVDDR